jgi:chromosome segregation ATPase
MIAEINDARDQVKLRRVSRPEMRSRQELKALWSEGKLVGLFNVVSDALFEQCADFCIESPHENEHEQELDTMAKAMEKERSQRCTLAESVSRFASENLVLAERLQEAEKKLVKSEARHRDRCRRMSESMAQLRRELAKERADRMSGEQRLCEMDSAARKLQESKRQLRASAAQLNDDLQLERETVAALGKENSELRRALRRAERDEREHHVAEHLTQTDHLNRRLLVSFLQQLDEGQFPFSRSSDDDGDDEELENDDNNDRRFEASSSYR